MLEAMGTKSVSYRAVQILIICNLLLAIVAFIKDLVFASYFGTSEVADAISLAFFLPDTLGNNLIGAAIAVSSIPTITRLLEKNQSLYSETIQKLSSIITVGTMALYLILMFLSNPILQLFQFKQEDLVSNYFFVMAPIICLAPLWLLGSSVLQASRQFIFPAITPIIFNLILLFSLMWCQWEGVYLAHGGKIYALITTIATFSMCFLTWYVVVKKQKLIWTVSFANFKRNFSEVKKIFSIFIAYCLILFFSQAALFSERLFASSLETGTIAALTYAYRISQFPIWVFIAAINTFILPSISLHIGNNDFHSLQRELIKSFLFVIGISVLLSIFLVTFSEPLLKILFARGSFTLDSVQLTSEILKGYGLSIVGQSLYVFCTRYYVARGMMKVPLQIGLVGSSLNISLLFIFVPWLGALGIGYAAAISASLSGAWMLSHFIINLYHVEQKRRESIE